MRNTQPDENNLVTKYVLSVSFTVSDRTRTHCHTQYMEGGLRTHPAEMSVALIQSFLKFMEPQQLNMRVLSTLSYIDVKLWNDLSAQF